MKILLLGASGRTGSRVLAQALARGLEIVALVRNPSSLTQHDGNLTIIEGTPLSAPDLVGAARGCDAVISALNNNRASDAPWARPVSPPAFMTDSMRNVVAAMQAQQMRRVVVLGAAGAADSFAAMPWPMRMLIRHTNLDHTFRDHDGQEQVLRESGLDWTIARPVSLSDKPSARQLVATTDMRERPSMTVSRDHVARFLLDSLGDDSSIARAYLLYERRA